MINNKKIGFIGMGLMGVPMSLRLLAAGFDVYVWNRNPSKAQEVVDQGAVLCQTAVELVSLVDIICLCVSDTAAVEELVFDSQKGFANHTAAHQCLIDFSSISPDATIDFAERLLDATGCQWIDAPVSGGVAGAEEGTLSVMAGGEPQVMEKVMPVLNAVSARVTHMGKTGSGQATKVCNQMIVSCNLMVMAEAMAVAQASGVDISKVPEALSGGFADSKPLQLTGSRMAAMDFEEVKWHVKTLLKDLNLADELAKQQSQEAPMSRLAKTLMQQHTDKGYADADPATLITLYLQHYSS